MKKRKICSETGVLAVALFLSVILCVPALASPPVAQLLMEKSDYTINEPISIGMQLVFQENYIGLAALFIKFESTAPQYAEFNDKYWSIDGFHVNPVAVIPLLLPLYDYGGANCIQNPNESCFLRFRPGDLAPGAYTFSALLMERLGFMPAEFENNPRLRQVSFTVRPPAEPITPQTLVGDWDFTGAHPDTTTQWSGTMTFNPDGSFRRESVYSEGPLASQESIGTWEYATVERQLRYQVTQYTSIYVDGRREERTDGASAIDIVEGDATGFTITQGNGWVLTLTRIQN